MSFSDEISEQSLHLLPKILEVRILKLTVKKKNQNVSKIKHETRFFLILLNKIRAKIKENILYFELMELQNTK